MEYPSGQSCSTRPPKWGWGRRARAGFRTIAAVPYDALWWSMCTQTTMHLAQAFGSTSLHKCEYLRTHGRGCVCSHGSGGVKNSRLLVTSPLGSHLSASSCPHPGSTQGRLEAALASACNWLHTASGIYVIWGLGWGGRDRNIN